MPTRRKKFSKYRKIILLLIVMLSGVGVFWFGRKIVIAVNKAWSGKEQIALAMETGSHDGLILTLTPDKEMVVVTHIPAKTIIKTPWFGAYQVGKLSLLVEQEGKRQIFNRSVSYYLGVPTDFSLINLDLNLEIKDLASVKNKLRKLFFPPRNVTFWRIWRYLSRKDLVWKTIDLGKFSQKDYLADQTEILRIKPERIEQQFWGYFSDPVVREEGLTISVFNVGKKKNLAERIGTIVQNMGIRAVEVADLEAEVEECLFLVDKKGLLQTRTMERLQRVFGCQTEIDQGKGIGEIDLLIKNVKID